MKAIPFALALGAARLLTLSVASVHAQIVAPPTPPVVPVPLTPTVPTAPLGTNPPPAPTARPGANPATSSPATDPLSPGLSKPPEYNSAPLVRVDLLMVSVPEDKALPLIPQLRDSAQIVAAEAKLLEMVARKEANLEGWPEVTTHSGNRAVSESIVEQRYPIEFDPAGMQTSPAPPPIAGGAKAEARPVNDPAGLIQNVTGIVPTTFETRNVGTTLEVEPVISPDRTAITLSITPQIVRFERFAEFPAGITAKGEKITVSQPIFATSKVSTILSLRDGERRLIHIGIAT
jgi:hypothetical protein